MTHHPKLQLVSRGHAASRTPLIRLALPADGIDDSLTTGPRAGPRPAEPAYPSSGLKSGGAAIVVTRTVTYRARGTHVKAPTRITASYSLSLTGGDLPAMFSWPSTRHVGDTLPRYQQMMLGLISVPATTSAEVCSNGKNRKSYTKLLLGMTATMEGHDDLPWTRMHVLQGGIVVGTYTAHWKRLSDRWILTSR
ncbi:MAG: hypothetical protein H0W68_08085 [Gemmatimonadaceae bacterium]|nr:hypothetical protein [Gemmatimonadaceae bacterium]